ncbi:MAG: peptidoglycan DD-metalloendopeptidase family protein [Acutalibacteraceae bacterium]
MKEIKTDEKKKKFLKQNKAFYVALTICIIAVAAAAWTTYGSVLEYAENQNRQISELMEDEPSNEIKTGQEVSNIPYESSAKESNTEKKEVSEQTSSTSMVEAEQTIKQEQKIIEPIKEGAIIKKYSPTDLLESKTMGDWRTHNGVDIAAEDGTIVRAMADGIVTEIMNDEMYGTVVRIEHKNGYTALYCGLSPTVTVKVGDEIVAGTSIGSVYIVPCERLDESHLHLIMYKNDVLMNPIEYWE